MKNLFFLFLFLYPFLSSAQTIIRPATQGIPISVCNHRFNAEMTLSIATDTRVSTSIHAAEIYGFKNNIRVGCFATSIISGYNYTTWMKEEEQIGIFRFDYYLETDMWYNPTTHVIEVIPDYYNTTWSSAGVTAFPETAILGNNKIGQYPNHGQQLYDITNGRLGYNINTSTIGSSLLEELYVMSNYEINWLKGVTNRNNSTIGYRNGQRGASTLLLPYTLGGRTSTPSPSVVTGLGSSFYGFDKSGNILGSAGTMARSGWMLYSLTDRWYDSWTTSGNTRQQADSFTKYNLDSTLNNHGWYRNFMHFHSAYNDGRVTYLDTIMNIFNSKSSEHFVWRCAMGEAIEYMYVRDLCSGVYAHQNTDSSISVYALTQDKYKSGVVNGISTACPLNSLYIPLSVKIDLTGTLLAGKFIVSSFGKIRSLGSNIYVLEIPFDTHTEGFTGITLSKGSGGYYNETVPTGSINISGNVLTVISNMPVKAALYSVTSGGSISNSLPVTYQTNLSTTHTFPITAGKDYRVGIISEFLQANLIQ